MNRLIKNFQHTFLVGITADEKWIITPGFFITHENKYFRLNEPFELKVKQKKDTWSMSI